MIMTETYAVMLLNEAGTPVNVDNIANVLTGAGIKPDIKHIANFMAGLISVAIETHAVAHGLYAPQNVEIEEIQEKPEPVIEVKNVKKDDDDDGMSGLSRLFG